MLTKNVNGETIVLSEEEEATVRAEWAKADAEQMATEYKVLRQAEYPPIAEQLDMIFHDGIDVWKAKIQEIKDKYPKPETK